MVPEKQLVVKYNGTKTPKLGFFQKKITAPREGMTFGKVSVKSAPQLKNALPLPAPAALKESPANAANFEVMTKKKLQEKMKKMIKGVPKRAFKLGKTLAHNAAPVMAKTRQGLQGALHKGAKVVKQRMDNYQLGVDGQHQQQLQQMMTPNTPGSQMTMATPTFSTTTFTGTPTTTITTDDEMDDDALYIEQLLANGKIDDLVELGKVNGGKENVNIAPKENELIDTREIALGYSDWRVENSCRSRCVWFLMILQLVLFISLIADVSVYTDVRKLLLPFGHILNTQTKATTVDDENEKYETFVVISGGLTLFVASIRIFLLLKVMEMEDADYQSQPSSLPCSIFQLFTFFMILFWFVIIGITSSDLKTIVTNFEVIFKAKEEIYASFSSTETMAQMDRLQKTFHCCGDSGLNSWYKLDMLKFLRNDNSTDVKMYWRRFQECHTFKGEEDKFKKAHSLVNNNNDVKPIYSVPYSCCSAEGEGLCAFYNINNAYEYWKDINHNSTLYNASCMDMVKPRLATLGLKIESLYFYRLLLEITLFLVMCVVQSSFDSYYENHHRPSIASLPLSWAFVALVSLIIFYCFRMNFFIWKYSIPVFFELDLNKLAKLVKLLDGSSKEVNEVSNSTNTPKS